MTDVPRWLGGKRTKYRPSEDKDALLWSAEAVLRAYSPCFFERQYRWCYAVYNDLIRTKNRVLYNEGAGFNVPIWEQLYLTDKSVFGIEAQQRDQIEDKTGVSRKHLLPPRSIFDVNNWNFAHPALFNSVVARELPYPWNQSTTPFSWASFTMHTTGVSFFIGSATTLFSSFKIIWDTRKIARSERQRLIIIRLLQNGAFIPGFTFLGFTFGLTIKLCETYLHLDNPFMYSMAILPMSALVYQQIRIHFGQGLMPKIATAVPTLFFLWGSTIKRPEFDLINRKFGLESTADASFYQKLAEYAEVPLELSPWPDPQEQIRWHLQEITHSHFSALLPEKSDVKHFYDQYNND